MRTTVQLAANRLPAPLREELNKIHPHTGIGPLNYECEFEGDDPRFPKIERLLTEYGYSRWPGYAERDFQKEYRVNYTREYEESDWEAAEYLQINPQVRVGNLGINHGRVQLPGPELDPDTIQVASAFFNQIVMPERWKVKLERERLLGVDFREADVLADQTNNAELLQRITRGEDIPPYTGEPWWELRSTITLPPVSETMTLTDQTGRPLPPGRTGVSYVAREGFYNHGELHYRRSSLKRAAPFDIARTLEVFGSWPRYVVSKRFYDTCRRLSLHMGWMPVRINED